MTWTWLLGGFDERVAVPGKVPILLLLVGLSASFLFIRTSTRLIRARVRWWPGNLSAGGVHLHHEFFGVLLLLVTGTAAFAVGYATPWTSLLALLFGIGAGLVLDEFALLLHLRDDYWSREGQESIDAVIVAVALVAALAVGVIPFGAPPVQEGEAAARWLSLGVVLVVLGLSVTTALKGKPWLAMAGVAVPVLALVGAVRLATPHSPWARRCYRDRPDAVRRATARSAVWDVRKGRLLTVIGGAPSSPDPTNPPGRPTSGQRSAGG
jgi:hypothetical protein